ncbi:MAG: histidine phosphatase family protein [Clostridia bacterium]|nr:histidine phosphatase family protein [Clostridia bacterium]
MLFFYIRHGEPTYVPDALTPLGWQQAEAIGKRLAVHGMDRIFSSTSTRAMETATPLCKLLGKEMTTLEFAHETLAYQDFHVVREDGTDTWLFDDEESRRLLLSPEVLGLGHEWYKHPKLTRYEAGCKRIAKVATQFFESLGYERVEGTPLFKVTRPNEERVALFAHAGFGLAFLSWLMDIPYPRFATQFDLCHTGMCVIEFKEENGLCHPKILIHSADGHLYKEDLPLDYNHRVNI